MKEKILEMVNAYWKFDNDQLPISGWHDKQDLLKALEELLQPATINRIAAPEWLTDEIRVLVKTIWNDHKDFNDNKRVEAMRIIQRRALSAGYTISIKKAMELLQQYCL
jgi:hypothetical protein